ncbi:glutamine synthetase [Parabacteroides bouchesdurhonensis]|uniref:glutamine synthetase n=1 Tax=Parabacteroides bouchesdurhonensis TaxID=1936995 RepID=UPI000C827DB2|nr:glutamine synthetase [Parabacteroides bouchesdurhonensis]
MSTVRFSLVTVATKSWVAEAWEKVISGLFGGHAMSETNMEEGLCESKWETELRKLQNEVHSLCHQAIYQLLPMAGAYQQSLLDESLQAYSVYSPEEAEQVFRKGNQIIENIKGHISGIRYNASKMRAANRQVNKLEDMHAKAIMYHNSVKPYMDTLHYHMEQLKAIVK